MSRGFSTQMSVAKAKEHKYLYHHTNYATLLFMLKDKNIRLSRIDKVCNDELEYLRLEDEWWRLYYVACFTYDTKEDFYFWDEYGDKTKKEETIRIRFANNFRYKNPYYILNDKPVEILPMNTDWEIIRNKVTYQQIELKQILYDDELAVEKGAIENNGTHSALNHAGLVKKAKWQREKECRIHTKIWNMHPIGIYNHVSSAIIHSFGKVSLDIPYIFLPLEENIFNDLEVVFSPYMGVDLKDEIKNKLNIIAPKIRISFIDSSIVNQI